MRRETDHTGPMEKEKRVKRVKLEWKDIRKLVLGGFLLFVLIYLYLFSSERLVNTMRPVLIGIALAYLLSILIKWLEKHDFLYNLKILRSEKAHKTLCAVLAGIILVCCLTLIFGYMVPQLTACVITLMDKIPGGIRFLLNLDFVTNLIPADTMETLQEVDWTNWINHLVSIVNSDDLIRSMTSTATSAISVFTVILFGVMFAVYFLAGRDRLHRQLVRMTRAFLPDGKEERFFHYSGMLNRCFHDFIVCQAIQALITGIASTAFLLIFRFPYATMIGVLNGFCALLPIIGGYIGAILGTLMILADSPQMALAFLVMIVIIQNVVGTLVFPRLASQSLGLPAVWTLAAVTVGSGMAGISGIIIGVPVTAFAYRCLGEYVRKKEAVSARKEELFPEEEGAADGGTGAAVPGTNGKEPKSADADHDGRTIAEKLKDIITEKKRLR